MSKKKAAAAGFEEQLARLQQITEALERGGTGLSQGGQSDSGDLSLEQSLELYKEGVELAAGCRKTLEQAKHTVQMYTEEGLREFKLLARDEDL